MNTSLVILFTLILSTSFAQPLRILVNHLGYEKNGTKHAVVQGKASDVVLDFEVLEYPSNKKIFSGKPTKAGPVGQWKDWHFWTIDFDQLTSEGTYYLTCSTQTGKLRSFPFLVQQDLLERNTLSNVVYYFKGQRSSGLLDQADRQLRFEGDKSGTEDVHGGWFDATGDYGSLSHLSYATYFNPQQTPLTVWSLLKTYQVRVENIVDDYCALMAATELYKATRKASYKQAADLRAQQLTSRLVSEGKYKNYWRADQGTRPFFHAADAGLPVVALSEYLSIADAPVHIRTLAAIRKSLEFELAITSEVTNPFGYARQYVQRKRSQRRSMFFFPHDAETAPWWQGENARLGSLATAARMTLTSISNTRRLARTTTGAGANNGFPMPPGT